MMKLNKMNVELAIRGRFKAILIDMPQHKCLVGIPGTAKNESDKYDDPVASYQRAKRNAKRFKVKSSRIMSFVWKEILYRAHQEQANIATYAKKVHFGSFSENIPPRPFLTSTFEEGSHVDKIVKKAAEYLRQCAKLNTDAAYWLEKLGIYAAVEVKKNIKNGDWKPNSLVTKIIKGSDKPLIDTKSMSDAVTSWVVRKR